MRIGRKCYLPRSHVRRLLQLLDTSISVPDYSRVLDTVVLGIVDDLRPLALQLEFPLLRWEEFLLAATFLLDPSTKVFVPAEKVDTG